VHVDLLLQVAVKKRRLDVYLVDAPTLLGSQRKEPHRLHLCYGGESIIEVDPLLLHETFGRLLGFGDKDRKANIIHNEGHKKADQIVDAYELEELADGTTTTLKSTYYVMNNVLRETMMPKGGSDSTSPPHSGSMPQI
jgi:hypothetical protein